MITSTDAALIRDEVGDDPADDTLEEWFAELEHWTPVTIRTLEPRWRRGPPRWWSRGNGVRSLS